MKDSEKKTREEKINIRQLFRDKNPRLARLIPGFIYRYLQRILHLDFVNYFLEKHGHKKGADFANASIKEFNVSLEVTGRENLPDDGGKIFVSNHPLGGFDGLILVSVLHDKYQSVKVLVNDLLMNLKNMDEVFVPINKHGKQSLDSVREIDKLFREGYPVLTFPAGLVSRRKKGVIRDPEWKKNFITKAITHKRNIVPIYVSGRCTNFFYNLSNIRKFLGIKANIEMLYLPDETYQHTNEDIKVIIGKEIPWEVFDKRRKPAEWALEVQNYVYKISKGEKRSFQEII